MEQNKSPACIGGSGKYPFCLGKKKSFLRLENNKISDRLGKGHLSKTVAMIKLKYYIVVLCSSNRDCWIFLYDYRYLLSAYKQKDWNSMYIQFKPSNTPEGKMYIDFLPMTYPGIPNFTHMLHNTLQANLHPSL